MSSRGRIGGPGRAGAPRRSCPRRETPEASCPACRGTRCASCRRPGPRPVWKSKFYGAFVLNRRVDLHAIDAPPARWRGDAGSSPLGGAAPPPRNVHPTHWLISTQPATISTGASTPTRRLSDPSSFPLLGFAPRLTSVYVESFAPVSAALTASLPAPPSVSRTCARIDHHQAPR